MAQKIFWILNLEKRPEKKKRKKRGAPKRELFISLEAAAMVFAMFDAMLKTEMPRQVAKLLLRGPDLIKNNMRAFLESHGENIDQLMAGEPATPTSATEVREFVEPLLKKGLESTNFTQMVDIYLFRKELTPESVFFTFYIMIRFTFTRERKPNKLEAKLIWNLAETLTRTSKIGAPKWEELETKGGDALKNWLRPIKESARKKYETFLIRKKKHEASAERIFTTITSMLFGTEEIQ